MTHALRRGVWLLGFFFMVCAFLFQAFALHVGRLSVVQPILTMELLFLVFILGTYFGYKVRAREWIGVTAIARPLGSSGLRPSRRRRARARDRGWSWSAASPSRSSWSWGPPARGPRWWKAAMFGTAAAMSFAFTAALIKVVSDYAARDWVTMFAHWQTYGLIVFGLTGLF